MNSFRFFLLAVLLCPLIAFAQDQQPRPPAERITNTITPKAGPRLAPAAFINPMDWDKEQLWDIKLRQKGTVYHKIDDNDKLAQLKAKKTAQKIEASKKLAGQVPPGESDKSVADIPVVLTSFEANQFDTWSPPDNEMAISTNGYIVSVINSAFSYYDRDGNALLSDLTYGNFLSQLGISNFLFDPKVLYDPVAERFIMVVLSGNNSTSSQVVVAFSVAEDPSEGWNIYTFGGDYLDGNWFDYPNIGISANDLFISGNLFTNDDDFDQTVLLQIKKENGYQGTDMEWEYFNDVSNDEGAAFTVVPLSHGYDEEYGPGVFMVSTRGFGGENVWLYEVTDSVNADQTLNAFTIPTTLYEAAGSALQQGSTSVIGTGGCRIRNGFYSNGFVHFVFGFDLNFTSYSAVRYTRINVETLEEENASFGIANMDCAYPSIIPFGMDSSSEEVMIGFLNSNQFIYPQMSVVHCDGDLNFSEHAVVKTGEAPITTLGGANQRWGDYSGGGRMPGADYPNAWFVGCYGKDDAYGNWIYEVSNSSNGLGPIADFDASPRQFETGGFTIFNSVVLNGADEYFWTFDGGSPATSTDPNETVTYDTEGLYDVSLIVKNEFGSDTITKPGFIRALTFPVANFTSDVVTGQAPLTVNYENLSTNIVTITWVLQGGNPSFSSELNPVVVYENPGTYNVNLIITNESGTDLDTRLGYIEVTEPTAVVDPEILDELIVFPNPIENIFKVGFYLPNKTELDIAIIDAGGKRVKNLFQGKIKAGRNELSFNKNALPAGTYFLVIQDASQNLLTNEKIIISK